MATCVRRRRAGVKRAAGMPALRDPMPRREPLRGEGLHDDTPRPMRLRRLASAFATIALLANLLAAALPLGARASAWPTTIVVCTAHGPVTVAASDLGEESPAAPSEHDCCSLCRLASDAPALPVPAPVVDRVPARDTASPPLAAAPASADSPTRRARAPPAAT